MGVRLPIAIALASPRGISRVYTPLLGLQPGMLSGPQQLMEFWSVLDYARDIGGSDTWGPRMILYVAHENGLPRNG
jgi:hypothetical protein